MGMDKRIGPLFDAVWAGASVSPKMSKPGHTWLRPRVPTPSLFTQSWISYEPRKNAVKKLEQGLGGLKTDHRDPGTELQTTRLTTGRTGSDIIHCYEGRSECPKVLVPQRCNRQEFLTELSLCKNLTMLPRMQMPSFWQRSGTCFILDFKKIKSACAYCDCYGRNFGWRLLRSMGLFFWHSASPIQIEKLTLTHTYTHLKLRCFIILCLWVISSLELWLHLKFLQGKSFPVSKAETYCRPSIAPR